MSKILIVAEHDGTHLNHEHREMRDLRSRHSPARRSPSPCLRLDASAVAAEAAKLKGVTKVLKVDNAANAHAVAAVIAPQVAALAGPYTHVFGPSTTFGKDLMPRVAALLDTAQISDVMAVESATRFRRPIYAGNSIITVDVDAGSKVVATVRTASFDAATEGGNAAVEAASANATLPTAYEVRVGVGGEVGSPGPADRQARRSQAAVRSAAPRTSRLVYQLADKLGAAVGASRAAVDAGYAANDLQVGQTGKIIAP